MPMGRTIFVAAAANPAQELRTPSKLRPDPTGQTFAANATNCRPVARAHGGRLSRGMPVVGRATMVPERGLPTTWWISSPNRWETGWPTER